MTCTLIWYREEHFLYKCLHTNYEIPYYCHSIAPTLIMCTKLQVPTVEKNTQLPSTTTTAPSSDIVSTTGSATLSTTTTTQHTKVTTTTLFATVSPNTTRKNTTTNITVTQLPRNQTEYLQENVTSFVEETSTYIEPKTDGAWIWAIIVSAVLFLVCSLYVIYRRRQSAIRKRTKQKSVRPSLENPAVVKGNPKSLPSARSLEGMSKEQWDAVRRNVRHKPPAPFSAASQALKPPEAGPRRVKTMVNRIEGQGIKQAGNLKNGP